MTRATNYDFESGREGPTRLRSLPCRQPAQLWKWSMRVSPHTYLEIVESLTHCVSEEELHAICERLKSSLGYEMFLYGAYMPAVEQIFVIDGFPVDWRDHYEKNRCAGIDPTVRHCWTSSTAIPWNDLEFSCGKTGAAERAFMDSARQFGLMDGLSVPIHGAGTESGMMSLVNSAEKTFYSADELGLVVMVTQSVHETLRRILDGEGSATRQEAEILTARETECLKWTAAGKTAWEISKIIRVSESTAVFHLKNAINKLHVTNRSHAVAKAIAQSRIGLF